jgi:chemotaxis response regulator CheB
MLGQGQLAPANFASSAVRGSAIWPRPILVADDSPLIRKMLCKLFEAEEDYDLCAEASNGREAIDLALKCRPELIILDFSMPVMNGVDAARELKKLMPGVPIILFTQHSETLPRDQLEIYRIVSKSDATELMQHVRSLLPA